MGSRITAESNFADHRLPGQRADTARDSLNSAVEFRIEAEVKRAMASDLRKMAICVEFAADRVLLAEHAEQYEDAADALDVRAEALDLKAR
jgi:hypothetical protein